jgi:TonB family protein
MLACIDIECNRMASRTLLLLLTLTMILIAQPFSAAPVIRTTRVIWADGRSEDIHVDVARKYLVSAPRAEYPYEARLKRLTGVGLFELRIDKAGTVKGITIIKSTGHQLLDQAAMRGFIQWRFKPGIFRKAYEPVVFATVP